MEFGSRNSSGSLDIIGKNKKNRTEVSAVLAPRSLGRRLNGPIFAQASVNRRENRAARSSG
jgi:hypothetical protein